MTQIQGLFGTSSPNKIEQDYLNQFLVSPAQMGQQGLLQQVVSLMSNAGANIGAQGSRMLGGQLPEIQERETIGQVYQDVKQLGLQKDSEVYTELAKRLADIGLTDKASIASAQAAKYQQQELKTIETNLNIQGKKLENTLNRATLVPRIEAAFLANDKAEVALQTAKQNYAQRSELNPIQIAQAEADLRAAEQNYAQTSAQMAQFKVLSPEIIAQARAATQTAKMDVKKKASLQASQQAMSQSVKGSPEYNAALDKILAIESPSSLTPKPVNFGTDREAYSSAMYGGKPFKDLTPIEQADVNLKLKEKSVTVARAGAYELGRDLTAFDKAVEKPTISFQAAKTAKALLREAKASNNPDAWNGGIVSTARAITIGKLSDADIRRYGGTPEIVQSVKDLASKAFTGIPTIGTQNKLYVVLSIIERAAADEINRQSDRFTAAAKAAGIDESAKVYFPQVTADGVVKYIR